LNLFNDDFRDFILAFNETNVDYILVGGFSVVIHGYNRATGDMDIWVRRSPDNYAKIVNAFSIFGMPVFDMSLEKFLEDDGINVFTFGRKPVAIDLMTGCKGLDFEETFQLAEWMEVDGLHIKVIGLDH
jgi:hypothetical protein